MSTHAHVPSFIWGFGKTCETVWRMCIWLFCWKTLPVRSCKRYREKNRDGHTRSFFHEHLRKDNVTAQIKNKSFCFGFIFSNFFFKEAPIHVPILFRFCISFTFKFSFFSHFTNFDNRIFDQYRGYSFTENVQWKGKVEQQSNTTSKSLNQVSFSLAKWCVIFCFF